MKVPYKQIRAVYNDQNIRIYQAYNDSIADSALKYNSFVTPPFKLERMTWIKPSFLWMMYRSGWGMKESSQSRILAIDISRKGFDFALNHSCLSCQSNEFNDREEWLKFKRRTPVRIQWDPERDLYLQPLNYRTIQIGLSKEIVGLYVNEWIRSITEVTELASQVYNLVISNKLEKARELLPEEKVYPLSSNLREKVEAS
jgi:hypothetical protein